MASNLIPKSYDPLVQLLEDAADGARSHGATVGLKQNDEAALRSVLADLIGTPAGPDGHPPAQPGLKSLWNAAKAAKVASSAAMRSTQSNGRALAMACVGTLKPRLGNQWNAAWQMAGFAEGSLQVPANPLVLLRHLRAYYETHPDHEVPNLSPTISCTAAACEAAAKAIGDAQTASNQGNADAGAAQSRLAEGIKAARNRLSGLREELSHLIAEDDSLWYAFGFDRPGDPKTPDVPQHLIVTPGAAGSGALFIDWDDARRAEGYRVRVVDATGKSLAEAMPTDSETVIDGLASGASVSITVSARNAAGESRATDPVNATVP